MRFATVAVVVATAIAPFGAAAQTLYTTRAAFTAAAGPLVTDDYQSGYGTPGSGTRSFTDAQMSAVKGITQYTSTGFPNTNFVFTSSSDVYCAGCNGSFRLSFTGAAFGGLGTTALGFDYANGATTAGTQPYTLFLTFANGSTQNVTLVSQTSLNSTSLTFIGVTSAVRIVSAHLGLAGGGAATTGGFVMDNLSVSAVPEPATAALMAAGLLLLVQIRRQRTR